MLLTLAALLLAPQADCTARDSDSWLTPIATSSDGAARKIHSQRVVAVTDDQVKTATAYLSVLPFKPLTDREAASFTGRADPGDAILEDAIEHAADSYESDGFASAEESIAEARALRGKLSPWLVRAVYPTPNAFVGASWFGTTLSVTAGGMGCAPFARHPVVIWLDKMPHRVEVTASAAL